LLLRITRPDGAQPLDRFDVTLPAGVTAQLAGVAECPAGVIAQAEEAADPGEAALELQSPSCPAASRVGRVEVGVGAGSHPVYFAGEAYLGGPYRGSPASLVVVVPVSSGPFDLGTVVVRIALDVDPVTARMRATSEPLPGIISGVPIALRDLRLEIDRPGFIRNPTSCAPLALEGSVSSPLASRPVSSRFQVGGCRQLGFEPRISLRLMGPTHRGAHPKLRAAVRTRPADANLRRLALLLPAGKLLDFRHIRGVCGAVELDACPRNSVYGHARVWSPLLDEPLEGPVFLHSSRHRLPDLVVSLEGRVDLVLRARIDSVRGRLRATFAGLPDIPLRKFMLTMRGGRGGLFVNARRLCSGRGKVSASFVGQNAAALTRVRPVATDCDSESKQQRTWRRSH
jgi:hypothetical protein